MGLGYGERIREKERERERIWEKHCLLKNIKIFCKGHIKEIRIISWYSNAENGLAYLQLQDNDHAIKELFNMLGANYSRVKSCFL